MTTGGAKLQRVSALTSKICFWPHFLRGQSNKIKLPHTSSGASQLSLGRVLWGELLILRNFLDETMCSRDSSNSIKVVILVAVVSVVSVVRVVTEVTVVTLTVETVVTVGIEVKRIQL